MKQSIGFCQFTDAFRDYGREDDFSYEGLKALFEYFEQWGEDCGEEIELDVVAICCEFTEYEDLEEFHGNYSTEDYPDLDTLRNHTQVIEINSDSFIIQDF